MKFNGEPQQLAHILTYVQEYGQEIPTEGAKVRSVTLGLEGAIAHWMMTLHNVNAPKLYDSISLVI